MSEARAFAFRERAFQAYKKAMRAGIPEEIRRAWLIVERDWTRMAEREEVKVDDTVSRHLPRDGSAAWLGLRSADAGVMPRETGRAGTRQLSPSSFARARICAVIAMRAVFARQ